MNTDIHWRLGRRGQQQVQLSGPRHLDESPRTPIDQGAGVAAPGSPQTVVHTPQSDNESTAPNTPVVETASPIAPQAVYGTPTADTPRPTPIAPPTVYPSLLPGAPMKPIPMSPRKPRPMTSEPLSRAVERAELYAFEIGAATITIGLIGVLTFSIYKLAKMN